MEEIAKRFKEEYTELLLRYKEHLSNAQIMSILQSVTKKQIGFKDNPERFNITKEHLQQIMNSGPSFLEQHSFKHVDDNTKAKEIIRELLRVLPKENVEGIYEVTEEAEQFLRESSNA